jgi:hypothetical protein
MLMGLSRPISTDLYNTAKLLTTCSSRRFKNDDGIVKRSRSGLGVIGGMNFLVHSAYVLRSLSVATCLATCGNAPPP